MAKTPLNFKDSDVQRAVKAARKAGIHATSVTINPKSGEITVVGKDPEPAETGEWDKALGLKK